MGRLVAALGNPQTGKGLVAELNRFGLHLGTTRGAGMAVPGAVVLGANVGDTDLGMYNACAVHGVLGVDKDSIAQQLSVAVRRPVADDVTNLAPIAVVQQPSGIAKAHGSLPAHIGRVQYTGAAMVYLKRPGGNVYKYADLVAGQAYLEPTQYGRAQIIWEGTAQAGLALAVVLLDTGAAAAAALADGVGAGGGSCAHSFNVTLPYGGQMIPGQVNTIVEFTVETASGVGDAWVHDDGNNYDAANYRYVVPQSGYYSFQVQLAEWDVFTEVWLASLEYSPDNGANWYDVAIRSQLDRDFISGTVLAATGVFAAGNWLRVRVRHENAGAQNLVGPASPGVGMTFFCGAMLYSLGGGAPLAEYPKRWTCWHAESIVHVGAAIVYGITSMLDGVMGCYQNPKVNGDTFTNGLFLAAGNYTLGMVGRQGPLYGVIDWFLDGVAIPAHTGQDWWAAANSHEEKTGAVVIATDGWHELKGVVNSAVRWWIYLSRMWFRQAVD